MAVKLPRFGRKKQWVTVPLRADDLLEDTFSARTSFATQTISPAAKEAPAAVEAAAVEEAATAKERTIAQEAPVPEEAFAAESAFHTKEAFAAESAFHTEEPPAAEDAPNAAQMPAVEDVPNAEETAAAEDALHAAEMPTAEDALNTKEMPSVEESAPMEEGSITEDPPAPEDTPAKKPKRRWAFWRRRKKEVPAPPPPPDLIVAPFDGQDYRTLSVLVGSLRAASGQPPMTQRQWAALRLAVEDGQLTYHIAWYKGTPVGICAVCRSFAAADAAPAGILQQFFVLPHAVHTGAGPALVQSAAAWVQTAGGHTLYAVCPAGHSAAYRALGFTVPDTGVAQLLL